MLKLFSNIDILEPCEGFDMKSLTLARLQQMAKELTCSTGTSIQVRSGAYLPDGLTQHGLDAARTFVDDVTNGGESQLGNVYMLGCTGLTRTFRH